MDEQHVLVLPKRTYVIRTSGSRTHTESSVNLFVVQSQACSHPFKPRSLMTYDIWRSSPIILAPYVENNLEHIIHDGIANDRFPNERNSPEEMGTLGVIRTGALIQLMREDLQNIISTVVKAALE
ncbi:UNVERIFIED_CONTAM: hypothetical protein Sindi_0375600 [Sesamum indicum]